MAFLTVFIFIVCYAGFSHASVIKPNSVDKCNLLKDQVLTALDNNDTATAKQYLQQYSTEMNGQISSVDNDKVRQNIMKMSNLLSESIEKVRPDKRCSHDDIKKILGSLLLFSEKMSGYGIATVSSLVGVGNGGVGGALDVGTYRLKKGDLAGVPTGALTGLTYGAFSNGMNNFFSDFRTPFNLLDASTSENDVSLENQIQTAFDNNDPVEAKRLLQQYSCEMKQKMPDKKDEQNRSEWIKTMNLLDQNLKEVKPDRDCSCHDLKILYKAIVFSGKLCGAYGIATPILLIDGAKQMMNEGLDTGLCRLNEGDLKGTATGILAGGLYGLNQGSGNEIGNKVFSTKL